MYLYYYFLNFYCYSITVICLFSPSLHPTPDEPTNVLTTLHRAYESPRVGLVKMQLLIQQVWGRARILHSQHA